ncbi:MAG: hypothetical protein GYA24_01420 [Candidatus Lokiarchaeota archaeon]|nr:hypothetical protein [Candidatus Lokiarchaeota archaeon]
MLDKESARAAWFQGFDAWQAGFNQLLKALAAGQPPATAGKAFLRDVMTPWMDEAKDRLLRAVAADVLAIGDKAKQLDGMVNKQNI